MKAFAEFRTEILRISSVFSLKTPEEKMKAVMKEEKPIFHHFCSFFHMN